MEAQQLLESIYDQVLQEKNSGELANYIPELGKVDPDKLGVFLRAIDGRECFVGDYSEKFSIQSISKVMSLILVYQRIGDQLWKRVGVEPSGTAFNSLVQLEFEQGKPRNPFINSGAIVVCDEMVSLYDQPEKAILQFIHEVTGDESLGFNPVVAESERRAGYRNIALVNFLKSFDNLRNDTDRVLDFYFMLSSLEMSCQDLVSMFMFLSNEGVNPTNGKQIVSHAGANRLNAIMSTCGFYDEAGEFAYRVGLPGKSGVGGGIVALLPGEYTVAVWSPRLNPKGNSFRGMRLLELLTTATQATIF